MSVSRILIGLTAAAALAVGTVYVFQPIKIGGATISFHWLGTSGALIERLSLPADATITAGTDVIDPDGTMPEIATRSFSSALTVDELRAFYLQKCAAEGLTPATPGTLNMEPATICEARINGRRTDVLLMPDCRNGTCEVTLETRVLF